MRYSIDNRIKKYLNTDFIEESSEAIETCKIQLEEYFRKERRIFDLPILMVGTEFQKQVWNALIEIPYSRTSS